MCDIAKNCWNCKYRCEVDVLGRTEVGCVEDYGATRLRVVLVPGDEAARECDAWEMEEE